MSKMPRLAAMAAVLIMAVAASVIPQPAQAQTPAQPPAASAAVAPAEPAAAPAAAPAAKAASGGKTTEVVDNPYGFVALLRGSDIVAKVTLAILAIMSMGSWYIIITKVYEQAKMRRHGRAVEKSFWGAPSVRQGADALKKSSPFRFIAETGIEASTKHTGLLGNVDMNEWISMSIQRSIDNVQSRTQDGLAFLATVGSTAPFVGLFGTVWGIVNALTAIGLAVAVPAVLGYNWLVRRNKAAMDDVRSFGADLHAVLLSAPKSTAKA